MQKRLKTLGLGALVCAVVVACGPATDVTLGGEKPGGQQPGPGCTPLTVCPGLSRACGALPDGCGGTYDCGGCSAPATCGAMTSSHCGTCDATGFCSEQLTNPGTQLEAGFALSGQEAWFVGSASDGKVHQWTPAGWTDRSSTHARGGPERLWGASSSDVWGTSQWGLWHWDGKAWALVDERWTNLTNIGGSGADDVWAVGWNGVILHYDGKGWTQIPSGTTRHLLSVSARAKNDAWVSGKDVAILHWDGAAWSDMYPVSSTVYFRQILGLSPTEAVVVSSDGDVELFSGASTHLLGTGQSGNAFWLWAFSKDDVWAFGKQETVEHFNGTAWETVHYEWSALNTYRFVAGSPDGDLWAGLSTTLVRRAAR